MVFPWITGFLSAGFFMSLRGPSLMFPGISNRTGCSLFKSNIIRNGAENILLPVFLLLFQN